VVQRLLRLADDYYHRGDLGIRGLPPRQRVAIRAARLIYAEIGKEIAKSRYDSISRRARTSFPRKLWLIGQAFESLWWRMFDNQVESMEPALGATFLLEAVRLQDLTDRPDRAVA